MAFSSVPRRLKQSLTRFNKNHGHGREILNIVFKQRCFFLAKHLSCLVAKGSEKQSESFDVWCDLMSFATCLQCQDIVSLDIFWSFRTQHMLWVAYANDVTFFAHCSKSDTESDLPWSRLDQGDVPSNNQIGFVMAFGVLMDAGLYRVDFTTHLKKLEESEHRIKEDEMLVKPFWRIKSFALPSVNDVIRRESAQDTFVIRTCLVPSVLTLAASLNYWPQQMPEPGWQSFKACGQWWIQ